MAFQKWNKTCLWRIIIQVTFYALCPLAAIQFVAGNGFYNASCFIYISIASALQFEGREWSLAEFQLRPSELPTSCSLCSSDC